MKKHTDLLLILIHAVVFVILFYKQYLGLNLLVFEISAITSILFIQKKKPLELVSKIVLAGTLLSGVFVVINFSAIAIFINICSFILFTGTIVYPQAKSILTSVALSTTNFFQSIGLFFQKVGNLKGKNKSLKWVFNFVKIALIPLLIITVFILIYNASNPIFNIGLAKVGEFLNPIFNDFFTNINFGFIMVFILGLVISIFTFLQVKNRTIINTEIESSDTLTRKRRDVSYSLFKLTGLKNEHKSALLLLASLNVLLLIINIIDINWVWFNFEWEGEYLKQFVHEGTYLLILSILISIGIVLFFFRGNLNFYSQNKSLKVLSYTWLAQNAILVISVAIRNFWYIKYFALAYKRIGVLLFLIVTLYGIYTVFIKVQNKKSVFYLLRKNILVIYCALVFMTFFNWDIIIARYNFSHYEKSFVHLNFLSNLSYKAIPYLDKSMDELKVIQQKQLTLFPFEQEYMSIEVYYKRIQSKKERFATKWNKKNLRSWNFSEWIAYTKMDL